MDEKVFLNNMADILEVDSNELSLDTNFREDIPFWNSLKGFAMIVMMEEEFNTVVSVEAFLQAKVLHDLYQMIK